MTILTHTLSSFMSAKWNSENGLLTLQHASGTKMVLTMPEQVELVAFIEEIVERSLPIGTKKT